MLRNYSEYHGCAFYFAQPELELMFIFGAKRLNCLPPEKDEDVILVYVEDVFSSKPRMKILKLLSRLGAVNVSEIARRISLNYSTTNKHLILLEAEGIIQQTFYGRIRIYKFNEASPKARAVKNLIEVWEQVNKQSNASNLGDK